MATSHSSGKGGYPPGRGSASGSLTANSLTVRYNLIMEMSDFEDAVYRRTEPLTRATIRSTRNRRAGKCQQKRAIDCGGAWHPGGAKPLHRRLIHRRPASVSICRSMMEIRQREVRQVVVLDLSGRFVLEGWRRRIPRFDEHADPQRPAANLLNFEGVTYLDSAAVGAIAEQICHGPEARRRRQAAAPRRPQLHRSRENAVADGDQQLRE